MISYLIIGIVLGLPAGLAPGPVLMLVISETLAHGRSGGIRVAFAPLITDLPVILAAFFIVARLADFSVILGVISLAGGVFILFLGYENIRFSGLRLDRPPQPPRSLMKGILTNILSPYPYLFWFSVGAPTMTRALQVDVLAVFAFLFSFYVSLVGSKVLLAIAVDTSRSFLTGKMYVYTSRALGVVLCLFAVSLFRDGSRLLGA